MSNQLEIPLSVRTDNLTPELTEILNITDFEECMVKLHKYLEAKPEAWVEVLGKEVKTK